MSDPAALQCPKPTFSRPSWNWYPLKPSTRTKTSHLNIIEPTDLLATDLTGRFPTISSRGYNYIIVCYIYDTNGIIVRPMKNRSTSEHIHVYTETFDFLQNKGLRPAIHKMDNECTQALRDIIVNVNKNKLQLVPPYDHRTNPAEKCIDTFKCHFISGINAMDPFSSVGTSRRSEERRDVPTDENVQ